MFDITKTEGVGIEDLNQGGSMPLLRIIQDLSPELKPQKQEYIEGAKVGDILFAKNEEIVPGPLSIIPLRMKALYTEWVPRDQGGGLENIHPLTITSHPNYRKRVKGKHDEWLGDRELLLTHYWFVLANIGDEWTEAIIAMTKSQLKVSRKLQTMIKKFRYDKKPEIVPPIFANIISLSTAYEENPQGDGYFNWVIGEFKVLDLKTDEKLLNKAYETGKSADLALPEPSEAAKPALNTEADDKEAF